MIRVADYVIGFLADRGVTDVFMLAGGGIMYLMDALGAEERIQQRACRHEQACAVAAEGYARATNRPGVCLVTTGPGAVNAISGIQGAWVDSLPLIVIAGQVRTDLIADYSKLRQKGPQEGNVLGMAAPVTKYSARLTDPVQIRCELEAAWHHAITGRPGPTLIEIPTDVQGVLIDETSLEPFNPPALDGVAYAEALRRGVESTVQALRAARRPLFLCGTGIRLGGAEHLLDRLLDVVPVPVVLPDSAKDLLPESHPRNMGVFGTAGQRRANFAVQSCDVLVDLAGGLCVKKTGFNFKGFAPRASKIIVDIDEQQIANQVVVGDVTVRADVADFLAELLDRLSREPLEPRPRWLDACEGWRRDYPIMMPEYYEPRDAPSGYVFMDALADHLDGRDVLVAGNGLDVVTYLQVFRVKKGQRTMTSTNWGAMGWDLPLAIGACIGSGRRTICVTGDGSVQMNVQELGTIRHYGLPIKVVVYNNLGYSTIRSTQRNLLDGRMTASDPADGVDNPDFRALAAAYGLPYERIARSDDIVPGIERLLAHEGPVLCELMVSPDEEILPKASAFRRADGTLESRPLEDMAPFLPRETIAQFQHMFDEDTDGAQCES